AAASTSRAAWWRPTCGFGAASSRSRRARPGPRSRRRRPPRPSRRRRAEVTAWATRASSATTATRPIAMAAPPAARARWSANGVIDTECGEVCDGDDVAGQTRPGGIVTCAPDCRRVDRSRCPANAPAPREICGNCIAGDLNGLVDFEDPACCAASVAGKLAKARLKARANGRTLLRLRGSLGGAELAASSTTEDVFLQVRTQPGAGLLCAEVPAG